ncbi:MAG: glutamine synthetase beta-grasp domain-containing protein [Pseudomonadota bacterium]
METTGFAEYIWIDGSTPTQQVRSKTRVVKVPDQARASDFPTWSFDGSSTGQAAGDNSDCLLLPVRIYKDPIRGPRNYLVLCEVTNADGSEHRSNQRSLLRKELNNAGNTLAPWLGFEQEYTLFRGRRPLGFPANGFPAPQGPYYCSAGHDTIVGRELADEHAQACLDAGLLIYGINAEVMPGQWEFQVGFRGIDGESCDALTVADDVWVARYLLHRFGERHQISVSFANKPAAGDWNGAGMHTNFSTAYTRDPRGGIKAIHTIIANLESLHDEHVTQYGDGLDARLTGDHETCDINTFRSGVAHRGASIRIPQQVALRGHGYLEDRRPGANADPYRVGACLVAAGQLSTADLRAA